ncbi:MAG: hypothetical protein IV088_16945 [Hydrogenophaga sp.]|uniref:aldose epimerase family protein n=1 Tax=Hydrogenophaga sp. TaxID=1904254 RepID=UPI0025C5F7B9|nr:hypothetical protein [Hydrogenophaga sp.]MBT9552541.1 hypothetical protein [Hydrogenophaga sp.]
MPASTEPAVRLCGDPSIKLRAGAYTATVVLAAGGRIANLDWSQAGARHPLLLAWDGSSFDEHDWPKAGAFPMLPFANRLPPGGFDWRGQPVRPQPGPNGFALHGIAHRKPWRVREATDQRAHLELVHVRGDVGWPWSWSARQDVQLEADGLRVRLTVRNDDVKPMPVCLGWYPYHPAPTEITPDDLRFTALARRELDEHGGDDGRDRAQGFGMRRGETAAFRGWDGTARLQVAGGGAIDVTTQGTCGLVLHRPSSGDYLCIEPVTALPGHLGRESGTDATSVLLPGEERTLS